MFSERDVLAAIADHGAAALKIPVSKLMSTQIISCSPEDEIEHVFDLMDSHHIRHIPVFEHGTVIGVVSIRDVLALRARWRDDPAPGGRDGPRRSPLRREL